MYCCPLSQQRSHVTVVGAEMEGNSGNMHNNLVGREGGILM